MNRVLVDTSVWIDHFRYRNDRLVRLLERDLVLVHPLIIGELACGTPPDRRRTLRDLGVLNQPQQATLREALAFIDHEKLHGLGCGIVDMLLLASTLMTSGASLWTLDRRLAGLSQRYAVQYAPLQ